MKEFGLSVRSGTVVDEIGALQSLERNSETDLYISATLYRARCNHEDLYDYVVARRSEVGNATCYSIGFALVYQIILSNFQENNFHIPLTQADIALQKKISEMLDDALEPSDLDATMQAADRDLDGPISKLFSYMNHISSDLSEGLYTHLATLKQKEELHDAIRGISDAFLPFYTKWKQHNYTDELAANTRFLRN